MDTKSAITFGLALVISVSLVCGTLIYISKASIAQAPKIPADDTSTRYEFKDFRHGNIVGLALLDRQIGRAWLLTQSNDEKGKKVRDEFKELRVEDLWQVDDDFWPILSSPGANVKDVLEMQLFERSVKDAARPRAVLAARTEAALLKLKLEQEKSKGTQGTNAKRP